MQRLCLGNLVGDGAFALEALLVGLERGVTAGLHAGAGVSGGKPSTTHQLWDSGVRWALQKTLLQWGQSPAMRTAADGHCVGLAVMVGFGSEPSGLGGASAAGATGML